MGWNGRNLLREGVKNAHCSKATTNEFFLIFSLLPGPFEAWLYIHSKKREKKPEYFNKSSLLPSEVIKRQVFVGKNKGLQFARPFGVFSA